MTPTLRRVPLHEPISEIPTARVRHPVMRMRWEALTYLHWDLDPAVVAANLPDGLEPDLHEGQAYVGLVPFRMAGIGVGTPGVPLPWSTFPETNVRTYVVGPDGGRGVYFHSLDITELAPTAVARTAYQLPYCWSSMHIGRRGDRLGYLAWRRWPAPHGASSRVIVEVGEPVPADQRTALDAFLSSRWSLYEVGPRGTVIRARVDHGPWPMRSAEIVVCEDEFVAAAGYDLGGRPPSHVRYGGGVEVRVGPPRRVG